MKTLERGREKIDKICTLLREETLEPAKRQAEELIKEGQRQAEEIIAEGQKTADQLIANARAAIDQEQNVFQSSLLQAARQSLELLRQSIETKFFNEQIEEMVVNNAQTPDLVAKLINAIVTALEKDGLAADLTAIIPHTVSPEEINAQLLSRVIKTLKEKSVVVGKFGAGAQVKMGAKNITIDITEEALKELMASFIVRKEFRKILFSAQ